MGQIIPIEAMMELESVTDSGNSTTGFSIPPEDHDDDVAMVSIQADDQGNQSDDQSLVSFATIGGSTV